MRTRTYKTNDEAAEAWNTWAGSRRPISQEAFNRLNEAIARDYPVENDKLSLPDGENAFGDLTIAPGGGYEHPWPRIYLSDYGNSEMGILNDDMFMIYKLRARWRLVEQDHVKLRRVVAKLLRENDRGNRVLNDQLAAWNTILAESGFPKFERNDLRGMDLSGMTITPLEGERVWLRRVNLSYSESHLLRIVDGNLYGAQCVGMKAVQIDLSHATAHEASFRGAYMPSGCFEGADLGFCDFRQALLSHCTFDGANCRAADFSSALLYKASFDSYVELQTGKRIFSDLSGVVWDDASKFTETVFNDFLPEQNKRLAGHIKELRSPITVKQRLASSLEIKPGLFGVSLNMPKLARALRSAWKERKKKA